MRFERMDGKGRSHWTERGPVVPLTLRPWAPVARLDLGDQMLGWCCRNRVSADANSGRAGRESDNGRHHPFRHPGQVICAALSTN